VRDPARSSARAIGIGEIGQLARALALHLAEREIERSWSNLTPVNTRIRFSVRSILRSISISLPFMMM
jgi:hypothetical protein